LQFDAHEEFLVAGEDTLEQLLALELLADAQEVGDASDSCPNEIVLAAFRDVGQTCLHNLGEAVEHNAKILLFLLADLALHNLGDDIEETVQKLAVDNLLGNSFGEGDEAGIDHLLALVLGVGDVIVELHYFLEEHQDVLAL
jgi:hypothetical protein